MGCSESKVEGQRAVSLCRSRTNLLAAAIHHRYALASAHAAYSDSLLSVSAALHRLLLFPPSSSSDLPLPARRKSERSSPPLVSSSRRSDSDSDHHINFLSSNSDEDSTFHSGGSSPVRHPGMGKTYYNRSQPPLPYVELVHPSQSYDTVQVGSFEPHFAYSSSGDPFSDLPGTYASTGGFFDLSSPAPAMQLPTSMAVLALDGASSSRAPPTPPRSSSWDFLNPLETYDDDDYTPYTPSWSSREARDEEGIPDLEEDEEEEIEEAIGDRKFASFSSAPAREDHSLNDASTRREDKESSKREGSNLHHSSSPVAGRKSNYKAEAIKRKNVAAPDKLVHVSAVADEIKAQFEMASHCAREVARLLEVGKRHYLPKHSLYKVPPQTVSSVLNLGDDKVMSSKSLASTLEKLYVWERKLSREVRGAEKMRLLLSASHKEMRRLVEKGAEAHKIDSMRNLIKKLYTKIRISIQVIGSISRKINRVRTEELWPRTTELVEGLMSMWTIMLECNQMQHKAISEVEGQDLFASGEDLNCDHANEIMQLELELHKWTSNFSAWINAQRNYAKALNGWLVLCLDYQPESTAEGAPPYTPQRIGAPPLFILSNSWSQAMDRTCEREVLQSMQAFAAAARRLWMQQDIDPHERMMAVRNMDRWCRYVEKNQKYIHKEVVSLNRKLAMLPAQIGRPFYQVEFEGQMAEASSMRSGLERVFEAMEEFSACSVDLYQELLEQCEEQ